MVNKGNKTIELFPATIERQPSKTLILKFPAYGLYDENKLDSPLMLLVAPESTINVWLGMTRR